MVVIQRAAVVGRIVAECNDKGAVVIIIVAECIVESTT